MALLMILSVVLLGSTIDDGNCDAANMVWMSTRLTLLDILWRSTVMTDSCLSRLWTL
jgi:hypothetical protein